jgi:pimeloyl-ACP methyl ester carboxylesterase
MEFEVAGPQDGPCLLLLHGFPSCSDEWEPHLPALTQTQRVLRVDLLGYGRAAKPRDADYSVHAHAQRLQQLLAELGVLELTVVAHDVGTSIALQLLSAGMPLIRRLALLNGGVLHAFHRPTRLQALLAKRPLGDLNVRFMSGATYAKGMRKVWGPRAVSDAQLLHLWQRFSREQGHHLAPKHLVYIQERRQHGDRWVKGLQCFEGPLALIWGVHDPVSGLHMLTPLKALLPQAQVYEIQAGHFPHVEQPQAVGAALQAWLNP